MDFRIGYRKCNGLIRYFHVRHVSFMKHYLKRLFTTVSLHGPRKKQINIKKNHEITNINSQSMINSSNSGIYQCKRHFACVKRIKYT